MDEKAYVLKRLFANESLAFAAATLIAGANSNSYKVSLKCIVIAPLSESLLVLQVKLFNFENFSLNLLGQKVS